MHPHHRTPPLPALDVTRTAPGGVLPEGFVIFESGTVLLAPLDADTPVPVSVDALAAAVGDGPVAEQATGPHPPDAAFAPVGVLVARFDGTALHAPSPAPSQRRLGGLHVRVLARPAVRLDGLPVDERHAAEELIDLGLLVPSTVEPAPPVPAGGVTEEPPPSPAPDDPALVAPAPPAGAPPSPPIEPDPAPRPEREPEPSPAANRRRRWWSRRSSVAAVSTAPTPAAEPPVPAEPLAPPEEPSVAPPAAGPVRVYSVFGAEGADPSLALGMIAAFARHHRGGALDRAYDLRPPTTNPISLLVELRDDPSPAIVLFADYSWTTEANLETSREVHRLSPGSVTVHGGPHVPRHPEDRDAFLADHPEIDVVVRLEGEQTVAELLDALDGTLDQGSLDALAGITGTTVRTPGGLVHAPDRPRLADLDLLPSPYLTGEYDEVDLDHWTIATIETDRGCPFRCTFCDWGSATGTKPRAFDEQRVRDEIEWIGSRGIRMLFIADANFGGTERDVGIARWIADVRARHGAPHTVIASFAKNTTEHIVAIVECWRQAGIAADGLTAIQTVDPVTLKNVRRQNIRLEAHDTLTETFRQQGLPLLTDLLIGLPGATVETFKTDLQRCMDLEVTPRIAEVEVLPNSPMNDPDYRREMQLRVGSKQTIISTYSASEADVEEMLRLRLLFRGLEHFGLMRHVLRYVQHEHGLRAVDLIHDIDRAISEDPHRWPGLTWVGRYLDLYLVAPMDAASWTDEVAGFLAERHGIERSAGLDTVLAVQRALLPEYGRILPQEVELAHDYAAWYRNLPRPGLASPPPRPLASYGPGSLRITDPADICGTAIGRNVFESRRDQVAENLFWMVDHWELASEVARPLAATAGFEGAGPDAAQLPAVSPGS